MIRNSTRWLILAAALSPSLGHAQALLHIRVLEGEGALRRVGTKDGRAIVVQITDEAGTPAGGVTVSFRLPEEGPSGSFEGGLKTDIATTTPDGRAAANTIAWNRIAGAFQVRITVVKSQVRAGTVVAQTLIEGSEGKTVGGTTGRRAKWIAIAAAVGGGAAAGIVAGRGGTPRSAPSASTTVPPPQVGLPTLTIGRP